MDNRKPAWVVNMYLEDGEYSRFKRSVAVFDTELEAKQHRDMCYMRQKDANKVKGIWGTHFDFVEERIEAWP